VLASPDEPQPRPRLRSQNRRPPLQPLQQQRSTSTRSKNLTTLSAQRPERILRACRRLQKMADQATLPQPSERRGRGRPRKSDHHPPGRGARDTDQQARTRGTGNGNGPSRTRVGGRGRPGYQQPRGAGRGGVPRQLGTDGTEEGLFDEMDYTDSDPNADRSAQLVLRPMSILSSSSLRRSPTRSPTRSKTSSTVVKKSQLAFLNPAVHFVTHSDVSQHGGLPEIAKDLWSNHISAALKESASIPQGLKVKNDWQRSRS
jgi:hypothetical protein